MTTTGLSFIDQLNVHLQDWYLSYQFTTLAKLRHDLTPFAIGIVSGGIIIPPISVLNGNEFSRVVLKGMEIHSAQQFKPEMWLHAIQKYGNMTPIDDLIQKIMIDTSLLVSSLPRIEINFTGGTSRFLWSGITEFCILRKCTIALDLAVEILRIIALGGPFDAQSLSIACDCTQINDFIGARLFQGVLDPSFSSWNTRGQPSSFLTESLSTAETFEFERFINGAMLQDEPIDDVNFQGVLNQQAQTMQGNVILNNDTELLSALTQLVQFDPAYVRYLSVASPSGRVKIGERPFLRTIRAKQRSRRGIYMPRPFTAVTPQDVDLTENFIEDTKPVLPKNFLALDNMAAIIKAKNAPRVKPTLTPFQRVQSILTT